MMVEEWCNYLDKYAKNRGRDYFFAINEWNVPCCFFDATNEKEWSKWMVESGKYAKKWGNVSIKKMWRNPELEKGEIN
jgi:hypothetical protein|tara:strand:+ start:192 stop:425 length:234 start_codon:yes stop_codon:yes gene_type:complete